MSKRFDEQLLSVEKILAKAPGESFLIPLYVRTLEEIIATVEQQKRIAHAALDSSTFRTSQKALIKGARFFDDSQMRYERKRIGAEYNRILRRLNNHLSIYKFKNNVPTLMADLIQDQVKRIEKELSKVNANRKTQQKEGGNQQQAASEMQPSRSIEELQEQLSILSSMKTAYILNKEMQVTPKYELPRAEYSPHSLLDLFVAVAVLNIAVLVTPYLTRREHKLNQNRK